MGQIRVGVDGPKIAHATTSHLDLPLTTAVGSGRVRHSSLGGGCVSGAVVISLFAILLQDASLQSLTAGVGNLSLGALRHGIRLLEADAPVEKQPQPCPHRMIAGFHHDEAPLWNRLQLVRGEQRALHHLEGLAGIVLSAAHRAGQHRAAAQRFGQHLGGLAVGGETAEDGILS